MTAERLLDLAFEYRESKLSRDERGSLWQPSGREPAVIAEEYEAELRSVLGLSG